MSLPDKCPNCGSVQRLDQWHSDRKTYACGTWINETRKGTNTQKSETCEDRRTINDAFDAIRAFLDGDRDAREMGRNWIAKNTP